MTVETGDNESDLYERAIKVVDVGIENRGGYEMLVVRDSAGNQYTSFNDNFMEELPSEKPKYVGNTWEILFTVTEDGYVNFKGFTEPIDEDPVEEEIDPAEFNEGYEENSEQEEKVGSERDNQITRQSAVHDATRIVGSMIASDGTYISKDEDIRPAKQDIKDEIKEWTEFFKTHHRTGEWPE